MTGTRFHAVVVAAGTGQRMGAGRPKQYLPLAGSTVLEHAVAPFLAHPGLDRLVIVLAADDREFSGSTLAGRARITTATGGATRAASVAAGVAALGTDDDGVAVLVHDGARPCLPPGDIDRLLAACGPDGALLAVPVRDTLKRADGTGCVAATVARERLWQALTPQGFPLAALRRAIAAHGANATDEAQAMEGAGHAPRLVEADATNFKVTHPGDLDLAAMILARHRHGDSR